MLRITRRLFDLVSVGIAGVILATAMSENAFAQSGQWTNQVRTTALRLYSVKAVDVNTGWVCGNDGAVLRTLDGGKGWKSVGDLGIGFARSIEAVDSNTAWVASTTTGAGGNASIFKTTNGGTSWQQVFSLVATGAFIDCIKMLDPMTGFAVGDPVNGKWVFLKTSDGGSTWARIATEPAQVGSETGFLNILSVISATDIRFVGGGLDARMYRTTDGGATWNATVLPLPANVYAQALKFNTPDIGIVGSSSQTAARTTDAGATWTPFSVPQGGMWALSGYGTFFFAANGSAVQVSTDNGQTWAQSYSGSQFVQFTGTDFVAKSGYVRGWVVGSDNNASYIAGYLDAPTSVRGEKPREIPSTACLYQNYPNPFNPSTVIRFQLPAAAHVKLGVYNTLGQEVRELVNSTRDAGDHTVQFDGSGLSSGVYYYRLQAGGYTETRMMVLSK